MSNAHTGVRVEPELYETYQGREHWLVDGCHVWQDAKSCEWWCYHCLDCYCGHITQVSRASWYLHNPGDTDYDDIPF